MENQQMSSSNTFNPQLRFYKIHFTLKKRIRYGQAIFVSGNIPELGNWAPSRAFRLSWNYVLFCLCRVMFGQHLCLWPIIFLLTLNSNILSEFTKIQPSELSNGRLAVTTERLT